MGPAGDLTEVSVVVAVDLSWDPEAWCRENHEELHFVLQLTKTVDVAVGVVVAATAMLEQNRFALGRVWERRFPWNDLVTIAAAACERLPTVS